MQGNPGKIFRMKSCEKHKTLGKSGDLLEKGFTSTGNCDYNNHVKLWENRRIIW